MQLSISNIAWDPGDDDAVAALLVAEGITCIDVAPGKLFASGAATYAQAEKKGAQWAQRGLRLFGMQSLLYGTQGLNMFGPQEVQARMLAHLGHICRLAGALGCSALTFGSPRNRDPGTMLSDEAAAVACHFFHQLADIARDANVVICLEANPARYGCRFVTGTREAAALVRQIGHPHLRLQLDLGTCTVNQEDSAAIVADHADITGHVHISEPDLQPVDADGPAHEAFATALQAHLPERVATIEMLVPTTMPPLATLQRAVQSAKRRYLAHLSRSCQESKP